MEQGSILGSLDRIEAAIERIEAASRQRAAAAPPSAIAATSELPVLPGELAGLEQRHVALKAAVEQALGRLDTVIADQS